MYLRFFILCLIGFLISPLSSAQYKRGAIGCSDFAKMEQDYKNNPNDPLDRLAYATCLITKGEDNKGLQMLYLQSDLKDEHATHINASYEIAEYIKTGGTFKNNALDKEKIEEAIRAYFKTLLYIKEFGQDYPPITFKHVEFKNQIELQSVYSIARLHLSQFVVEYNKSEKEHIEVSQNLSPPPNYAFYTVAYLEKTVKYARECANLPYKPHFERKLYDDYQSACRIYGDLATALLNPYQDSDQYLQHGLEIERLRLLKEKSCFKALPNCKAYNNIDKNIIGHLVKKSRDKIKRIFRN